MLHKRWRGSFQRTGLTSKEPRHEVKPGDDSDDGERDAVNKSLLLVAGESRICNLLVVSPGNSFREVNERREDWDA